MKSSGTSLLFLEKVFLRARADVPLRGVELFNLALLRDLAKLGYRIEMPVVRSWESTVRAELGEHAPVLVTVPDMGACAVHALVAGARLLGRRYDVLLLGNVGKSLAPLIRLLWRARTFEECVLIAHREATPGFARLCARLPGHVVAVNGQIAELFRRLGHPQVAVDYGVVGADAYYPAEPGAEPERGPVRFCVFGVLENAWKGADTAIAAYKQLPQEVRENCELHLAAYAEPPAWSEPGIKTYTWMDGSEVAAFLRSMDVLVVPSRDEQVMRETFSQVMVQGMLTGLPVLASDLPILTEKLDQGGGLICSDAAELADAMGQVAGDAVLRRRLGEEARATALERYVWDTARFARRYLSAGGRT